MKLYIETFKHFCMIAGFITAMFLYGAVFMAIGNLTEEWIGWLAYAIVTLLLISYQSAKEKLGAEL
jgi:cytochrome c biogenesis protein CcdA